MESLKRGWARFKSYGWKGWLFIFLAPTFHWNYWAEGFVEPSYQVWIRYVVDAIIGWVVIELLTQVTEPKPKKRGRKPLPKIK